MSMHLSATVAYGLKVVESKLWKTNKTWTGCKKHPKVDLSNQFQFEFCPHCGGALWETEELEIDGYDEGGGDGGGTVYGYKVIGGLCDEDEAVIACREERVSEPESFRMFYPEAVTLERMGNERRFKESMVAAGLWDEEQFGWWICNTGG